MDISAPNGPTAEPVWPSLSADDLRRLHFFAYLRSTGRVRPPAPIGQEVGALCAALLGKPPAPRATSDGRPNTDHGGPPLLWQAWAEKQKQRGA